LVDFRLEGSLECFVRIVGAKVISVADEDCFFVVIGVDEPTGNAVGAVASNFTRVGVEYINPVDLDPDASMLGVENINVRFAEDGE
jgi:hypothetical protein